MDVCLKDLVFKYSFEFKHVSILILMDVCLKELYTKNGSMEKTGFNPYFNGCLS